MRSFGDPKAQPPTPRQTPTSAVFPSPVFETPKQNQGSFTEPGSWTPRFADEYSVFNSTPGNLRGADGPFGDFAPVTPANSSGGHKRLLSAEGFAAEIATHVNHFSPNPNLPIPPVVPSRRLPSSPGPLNIPHEYTADSDAQLSPTLPRERSLKKSRRGTVSGPDSEPAPAQTATPPPSARKGGRKLAPKPNMQNEQGFDQPDFTNSSQQQQNDMASFMGNPGDLFSYPMSAPVSAPGNFWDASAPMTMDMDFGVADAHLFQPTTPSQNHPADSFDWAGDMHLFQDPSALPPPPSSNQENVQPTRRERPLAPKPQSSDQTTGPASSSIPAQYTSDVPDPFGIISPGGGVDPGLIFSRPQTAAMDMSFNGTADLGSTNNTLGEPDRTPTTGDFRRNSVKEARNGKLPDRAFASSPIKPSVRPGLGRSMSENRGKKARGRPLPALAPAARPVPQAKGSGVDAGRPAPRPSGRTSPLKHQHRLSSLASIPEAEMRPRSRASVKFTIDSHGRARAETTVMPDDMELEGGLPRSRSARDLSRPHDWESSDDESSTDDEPIIIPSRNTSFNASFALPDPRKPVGSIFHSSRRSISDRSTSSTQATVDGQGLPFNDGESEAETVMNEQQNQGGDATSELRKVVEDRQKRSNQMSGRSQRFSNSFGGFNGSTISPTSLAGSIYTSDGQGVRCVCNRNNGDESDGFMVQWYGLRNGLCLLTSGGY